VRQCLTRQYLAVSVFISLHQHENASLKRLFHTLTSGPQPSLKPEEFTLVFGDITISLQQDKLKEASGLMPQKQLDDGSVRPFRYSRSTSM